MLSIFSGVSVLPLAPAPQPLLPLVPTDRKHQPKINGLPVNPVALRPPFSDSAKPRQRDAAARESVRAEDSRDSAPDRGRDKRPDAPSPPARGRSAHTRKRARIARRPTLEPLP